jgi:hypothetical protein
VSQPVGEIKVRRGLETYGGKGESLVKGVVVNLSAIALSVKLGGSIERVQILGGLVTHGPAVEALEQSGGGWLRSIIRPFAAGSPTTATFIGRSCAQHSGGSTLCHSVGPPQVQADGAPDQGSAGLVRPGAPGDTEALCSLASMPSQRPNIGSRVTREGHARFWERPGVKLPRATRQNGYGGRSTGRSAVPQVAPRKSAEVDHAWTAPGWKELSSRVQQWSEQPCVRPVSAVHVTAGMALWPGSRASQQ